MATPRPRATRQQDLSGDWPEVRQGLADDIDHFVNVINRVSASSTVNTTDIEARLAAIEALLDSVID